MRAFEEQRARLSPVALELLERKAVRAAMTPQQWLQALTPLAVLDEHADREAAALRHRRDSFIGATAALVLAMIVLFALHPIAGAVALLGPIASIAGIAVFSGKKRRAEAFAVPDHLRETILPVIVALGEDAGRASTLDLAIDLTPVSSHLVRRNDIALAGWRRCTETIHARRWLAGRMDLADASRVSFAADDVVRTRSGTKRGSSGKIKSKTKKMRWIVVMAQTQLPADRWRLLDAPRHQTQYKLKVKRGPKRTTIVARQKLKTSDLTRIPPPQVILTAISEGHRCVQPVGTAR